jgi:small subunit ribosomal protein S1
VSFVAIFSGKIMSADMLPHNAPFSPDESYWTAVFEQGEVAVKNGSSSPKNADSLLTGKKPPFVDPALAPGWALARQLYEADQAIELTITGFNKGGLLAAWHNLPGFLPASQLDDFPDFHLASKRLEVLAGWQDRQITAKIIELDPMTNRLIFSERAALVAAEQREQMWNGIKPGDQLSGRVTNLAAFGAFVDLGGVEGLIHISELSWGRVVHPGDVLRPGQDVKALVLQVETETERIALSRKRLYPNPWQAIEERYLPGQLVQGIISNIVNFGAFAEVEEGLEGLIHISEISENGCNDPAEVLYKGEQVVARVLHVDGSGRRLALSLKGVGE